MPGFLVPGFLVPGFLVPGSGQQHQRPGRGPRLEGAVRPGGVVKRETIPDADPQRAIGDAGEHLAGAGAVG